MSMKMRVDIDEMGRRIDELERQIEFLGFLLTTLIPEEQEEEKKSGGSTNRRKSGSGSKS